MRRCARDGSPACHVDVHRAAGLAGLIATSFVSNAALAGDEVWLESVVVTARRLTEEANSVPLAVDVFRPGDPGAARVDNLQAISAQAPGFNYEPMFGATYGVPTLRGQSQPTAAGDNVALFVDGVYQSNRDVLDVEPLDLERIELVRGPQSTLFGHSAFAGALNYVPRAPTQQLFRGLTLEGGTDDWFGVQGQLSGPLARSGWLGRVAASYRQGKGTLDDASSGQAFGSFERHAIAASLARAPQGDDEWTAVLSWRYGSNDTGHPAVGRMSAAQYNCGSLSATSGLWSYFCGAAPVTDRYDLSDELRDSTSRHQQLAMRLAFPFGAVRLESDSSVYWGESRTIRDVDGSDAGETFGVCNIDRSCPVAGLPAARVERLVGVNEVSAWPSDGREVSQEFRLRGGDDHVRWLAGVVWFETRLTTGVNFGAARGDLGPNELYTALLPASPETVGPVSLINLALTDDPAATQFEQYLDEWRRRTLAGYVAVDWRPAERIAVRTELRHTHERFDTRNVTAFFAPNTNPQPPTQTFDVDDPRVSVDYAWTDAVHGWLSAARGSRSGGTNNVPGLDPAEQSFDPEYNWTYELGLRFAGDDIVKAVAVTGYYIDWQDTQIGTWASTPGVFGWVTANAPGVTTRGVEASLALQPTPWLRAEVDYSHVAARFRAGTDYPGVADFCGLSPTSSGSNICTIGAPRQPAPEGVGRVPWVDGNALARVPPTQWHAALVLDSRPNARGWKIGLRADVSHQDDMYENQIESLRFGRRTLVDAQLMASRGPWTVELWAHNLTDERYIRSAFEVDPGLYPTMPIPIDFIYGDGRRCGLTLRYAD